MSASSEWRTASKSDPCPLCEGADWCWISPSGRAALCGRIGDAPSGWRMIRISKDGRPIYVRDGHRAARRNGSARDLRSKPTEERLRDWTAEAERFRTALTPARLDALAEELVVGADPLRALGVGWATRADLRAMHAGGAGWNERYPDGAYVFPERDGRGHIVGLSLRAPDGRKGFPSGAHRGLVIPEDLGGLPDPVLVVEGASDVAACLSLGLASVGRPNNVGGAEDLAELLGGREVLVVGERDEKPDGSWPGRDGARSVASKLASTWRAPVRWTLPAEGSKDIREWLRARVGDGLDLHDEPACRQAGEDLLNQLIDGAEEARPVELRDALEPARSRAPAACPSGVLRASAPLPTLELESALPQEIASACLEISQWLQIAPEAVVTCLLASASAAIGNSRWVQARGLSVPLSLHYVTSILSGSGKSEVRRFLRRATREIEAKILARREEAAKEEQEYAQALEEWKAARRSAKGRQTAGERPEPPPQSPFGGSRVTFTLSESNLEGVVATLLDTPRGLLWATDEAHEIIGMLGAYGDGRRSLDAARLRKLTESQPVEIHRAKSNLSPIRRLVRPWVALDLDVQPAVLRTLFAGEDRVSGLTARLLMHEPRALQGKRRYLTPPPEPRPEVLSDLSETLGDLFALPLVLDASGSAVPVEIELTPEADHAWAEEMERLELEYAGASEERAGVLGHARGRLLRLAGVLGLLRHPWATRIEELDLRRAIVHIRYHLAHSARLEGECAGERGTETLADRQRRGLAEWIGRHGGEVSAAELTRGERRFRGAGGSKDAEQALEDLVAHGFGDWMGDWDRRPGAPSRRFRLRQPADEPCGEVVRGGDTPQDGSEEEGFTASATSADVKPTTTGGTLEGGPAETAFGSRQEDPYQCLERDAIQAESRGGVADGGETPRDRSEEGGSTASARAAEADSQATPETREDLPIERFEESPHQRFERDAIRDDPRGGAADGGETPRDGGEERGSTASAASGEAESGGTPPPRRKRWGAGA